jgi:hypothetical protein
MIAGGDSIETATHVEHGLRILALSSFALAVALELVGFFLGNSQWKHRLEFLAIVFFVILVVAEALAFAYERKVRILAKAREREKDEQILHLSQNLQESRAATDSIKQELDAKKKAEEEAERIRRTAPILTAYLAPVRKGKVRVYVKSENLIPFEYRYVIATENNVLVSGLPLSMSRAFPKAGNALFYNEADIQLDRVRNSYLELRYTFSSLSFEELRLPGHQGTIVQKYKLGTDQASLEPIPPPSG